MDIRSLQQVIAIRKHGSFAKAAEALGVSQPNLSKSVARLEDELKLKLFDRTAKGSNLTPVGELIIDRADEVIAETRDLARDAALLAGSEMGSVRIGGGPALMTPFLAPLMHGLARRHPGLQVHGETAPGKRLLPLLEARELDVVFMGNAPTSSPGDYVVELILEAPSVFVANASHPLAMERDISVARLAEFRCGGSPSPGSSNTRLLGFESENLGKYTASHYDLLLPLVLSGDALLLAPIFLVQGYVEAGEMVVLDVRRRIDAKFYFVATRAASFSPIVREVREHARAIGAQLRDDWRDVASQFMAAQEPPHGGPVSRRTPPARDPAQPRPAAG